MYIITSNFLSVAMPETNGCAICFDSMSYYDKEDGIGDEKRANIAAVYLPCGHTFCKTCLDRTIAVEARLNYPNYKCPTCRAQFDPNRDVQYVRDGRNVVFSNEQRDLYRQRAREATWQAPPGFEDLVPTVPDVLQVQLDDEPDDFDETIFTEHHMLATLVRTPNDNSDLLEQRIRAASVFAGLEEHEHVRRILLKKACKEWPVAVAATFMANIPNLDATSALHWVTDNINGTTIQRIDLLAAYFGPGEEESKEGDGHDQMGDGAAAAEPNKKDIRDAERVRIEALVGSMPQDSTIDANTLQNGKSVAYKLIEEIAKPALGVDDAGPAAAAGPSKALLKAVFAKLALDFEIDLWSECGPRKATLFDPALTSRDAMVCIATAFPEIDVNLTPTMGMLSPLVKACMIRKDGEAVKAIGNIAAAFGDRIDPNQIPYPGGPTPFMAVTTSPKVLPALTKLKAVYPQIDPNAGEGMIPAIMTGACKTNDAFTVVARLCPDANPNGDVLSSALERSFTGADPTCLARLVDAFKFARLNVNDAGVRGKLAPLLHAANYQNLEHQNAAIKMLFDVFGARIDPNQRIPITWESDSGQLFNHATALGCLTYHGNIEGIEMFVGRSGRRLNPNIGGVNGGTPLGMGWYTKTERVAELTRILLAIPSTQLDTRMDLVQYERAQDDAFLPYTGITALHMYAGWPVPSNQDIGYRPHDRGEIKRARELVMAAYNNTNQPVPAHVDPRGYSAAIYALFGSQVGKSLFKQLSKRFTVRTTSSDADWDWKDTTPMHTALSMLDLSKEDNVRTVHFLIPLTSENQFERERAFLKLLDMPVGGEGQITAKDRFELVESIAKFLIDKDFYPFQSSALRRSLYPAVERVALALSQREEAGVNFDGLMELMRENGARGDKGHDSDELFGSDSSDDEGGAAAAATGDGDPMDVDDDASDSVASDDDDSDWLPSDEEKKRPAGGNPSGTPGSKRARRRMTGMKCTCYKPL